MTARRRRWLRVDSPWPWLGYLVIYFFPWMARGPRPHEVELTLWIIPTFLVLYVLSYRGRAIVTIPAAAGMMTLAFIGVPVMTTATVFIGYASAALGWLRPRSLALSTLGVLVICTTLAWTLLDFPVVQLTPCLFFIVMTGGACILSAESVEREQALIDTQATVERLAALTERERIARDMHDLLGHQLSVVAVKADLAGKLVGRDNDGARRELEDIQKMARDALQEVRAAVDVMRNASVTAEITRARHALEASGVIFEADVSPELPARLERPLALVIREAITNIIRHAGASRCRLQLQQASGEVTLDVRDNGSGHVNLEGHGLTGMRERVQELGGRLTITGGDGTHLSIVLPLEEPA